MGGMNCKLYDENLVYSIIMATGNAVFNFIQENHGAELEELYDYLESNADSIIEKTIQELNNNETSNEDEDKDQWSTPDDI